jgi:hypothetical protein
MPSTRPDEFDRLLKLRRSEERREIQQSWHAARDLLVAVPFRWRAPTSAHPVGNVVGAFVVAGLLSRFVPRAWFRPSRLYGSGRRMIGLGIRWLPRLAPFLIGLRAKEIFGGRRDHPRQLSFAFPSTGRRSNGHAPAPLAGVKPPAHP